MERPFPQPPSAGELFGYAVHHALRALGSVIGGLLSEEDGVEDLAGKAAPQLRELLAEWDD